MARRNHYRNYYRRNWNGFPRGSLSRIFSSLSTTVIHYGNPITLQEAADQGLITVERNMIRKTDGTLVHFGYTAAAVPHTPGMAQKNNSTDTNETEQPNNES